MSEHRVPYMREIPRPTGAPMVAACGVTLLFAGLVTNWAVTLVGAVMGLLGAIAWFREVFPDERTEELPASILARPMVAEAPAIVEGRKAHPPRRVIPVEIHPYRTGVWGGLAGGVAMAAVACLWGVTEQKSLWLPINLLAGVLRPGMESMSEDALKAFNSGWFLTALAIHGVGSVFVGLLYTVALPMMPRRPIIFGGLLVPLLWSGMIWSVLWIVNPTLAQYISWPWFVASQLAFGITAGIVISRFNRVPTMQFLPISQRLGIERSGEGRE